MESKTGKRIVSKGAYAAVQVGRALLLLLGGSLHFLALLSGVLALVGVLTAVTLAFVMRGDPETPECCARATITALLAAGVTYAIWRAGQAANHQAATLDPGVPLTHANTADLPAPDMLVRASSEPMQAQEGVLLRAAAERVDTPPEQLVRASVGQGNRE